MMMPDRRVESLRTEPIESVSGDEKRVKAAVNACLAIRGRDRVGERK